MTLSSTGQHISDIKSDCSRKILEIKEIFLLSQTEIAARIGVEHNTIWRAEKKKSGSLQLFKGLELLAYKLASEELKRTDRQKIIDEKRESLLNGMVSPAQNIIVRSVSYLGSPPPKKSRGQEIAESEVEKLLRKNKSGGTAPP